jgi:hypothetical protein
MNERELIEETTVKENPIPANEWAFVDVIEVFEGLIVVQQFERTDV